jgi:crotonobetainyl-CoA:carnitine CoA-transferase CaiB-like acyl-CoA transferase
VSGVLEGIRVVDFSQYLAGPLLAMMLGDYGADVIRVDAPRGPRWDHPANAVLQRGKRSIVLDLGREQDRTVARQLAEGADVVVENSRPGVMERLGLGPEQLLSAAPRLVYCSLPGFAADDPRALLPAWEGVVESAAGLYLPNPERPEDGPLFNAIPVASTYAAFIAAHAVIAALIARERDGLGQTVEVSLFDACFEFIGGQGVKLPSGSEPFTLSGLPRGGGPGTDPLGPLGHYRCADGRWLDLCLVQERHVPWFARAFLEPAWADRWFMDRARLRSDPETRAEVRRHLTELFATRTSREWERAINEIAGVPGSTCQTVAEWLREDPHARDSGAVVSLEDPALGLTNQAGHPVVLSHVPGDVPFPRRPLDADHAAIVGELGDPAAVSTASSGDAKPLAGIRVVDVSQVLAGPTAARVLAEYGADVVKINSAEDAQLGMHLFTNSGKRTMLLNLKTEQGQAVMRRLIDGVDVFHQNFARGVAERLHIGEQDVRAIQPDVIYSSVSAFGYTGWRGGYRGREELGQAVTGAELRFGGPDEPRMMRFAMNDFATGHLSAFAILLALYHRQRTGQAQHVHASLAHTCTFHQLPFMVDFDGREWQEPEGQSARGYNALYRLYRASNRWFFLAAPTPGDLARLQTVTRETPLEDSELEALFATVTAEEWVAAFNRAGVAAHVHVEFEELFEDERTKRRGLSIVREHPGIGLVRAPGPGPRLGRTRVEPARPAAPVGADARDVLQSIGLEERLDELIAAGAIAERQAERSVVNAQDQRGAGVTRGAAGEEPGAAPARAQRLHQFGDGA